MRRSVLSIAALAIAAAALLVSASAGLAADRYELVLESRSYVPEKVRVARAEDSHLVIQFYEIPTEAEREVLARAGITLLDYIPNYAWTAHVRGGAVQSLDPSVVRAVFALRADDKIARSAVGQEGVRAFVYDGVQDAESVLSAHGQVIDRDGNSFTLQLDGDVVDLAAQDIVKYVMGPRPEKVENNDEIRATINADEVQSAPYNLSGAGVTAGMWDNGSAATNHDDYNARLTVGDGSSIGSHPAQVCGVMAGDGTRSTVYGGYPNQWAGVAPGVDIASYSWPSDVGNMDSEHSHAISNYDIILSQNSWSWGLCPDYCAYYGEYDDWSQNFDKLVRGSQGKKISVVFSAGNDGDCSDCAWAIPDYPYGTIPGPGSTAKNAIVVGSNDADDDDLSYYSSMGPTLDGRLKPDVVAPGCKSYEGITTTYTSNNYRSTSCGTSFSAPAVAGCGAVLMEDYIDKFGGEAWPSTVKALMIQGAEDQGNVGPDFQFGYGRVNIQNTVDIIRADNGAYDLIKEDTLSPAETWEYDIVVASGADLKVTLVWDDFEGDYGAGGTMLVNDLDLELEAPGGATYDPWVLDPGNPSWSATTGTDHLNNVEQVEVASPTPGTWTIRVTATVMPEANQDFSVVTNFADGVPDLPPEPPTGLSAVTGTGEGEIDVGWNANSEPDLDHYRLERDDNPSFSSPASFTTANTYYDDSGLVPGDTYYYRVFAVDAGGNESDPSNVDSAFAQDLPPSPPTCLVAVTGTGEGEIFISWNPNSEPDLDRYRLERSLAPDFEPGSEPFEDPAVSYTDTGLIPGTLYYYRVYAIDANDHVSDPSNVDSAVAQDLDPSTPTGLVATPGADEGEIDVVWDANTEPDLNHYLLQRDTDGGFPTPTEVSVASPSYSDTGLTPGETYFYRVRAVDDNANWSPWSEPHSAVATDLAPAAPLGLFATPGAGEGEIAVGWAGHAAPAVDPSRLARSPAPGGGARPRGGARAR